MTTLDNLRPNRRECSIRKAHSRNHLVRSRSCHSTPEVLHAVLFYRPPPPFKGDMYLIAGLFDDDRGLTVSNRT
mgnify:CR=1 FL=1